MMDILVQLVQATVEVHFVRTPMAVLAGRMVRTVTGAFRVNHFHQLQMGLCRRDIQRRGPEYLERSDSNSVPLLQL